MWWRKKKSQTSEDPKVLKQRAEMAAEQMLAAGLAGFDKAFNKMLDEKGITDSAIRAELYAPAKEAYENKMREELNQMAQEQLEKHLSEK